jgi:hypothetical protein
MIRQFFILVILLLSVSFADSLEIGISPANLSFIADSGEIVCKQIKIFSSDDIRLNGEDTWARNYSNNLKEYNLSSDSLFIFINYPKNVSVSSKKEINICISGDKPGVYYGAIIFRPDSGNAGVGNWIKLKVNGEVIEDQSEIITGRVIEEDEMIKKTSEENNISTKMINLIFTLILLGLFISLIYYRKKQREKDI